MTTTLPVGSATGSTRIRPAGRPAWSVAAARELAHRVLGGDQERMAHSTAVAARAASLSRAVAYREGGRLVAAAWLHDIGYASALRDTGFHAIDGARFLRASGWDSGLCSLVAHHSGSRFVAPFWGLRGQLGEFEFVEGPVSDALTVADQTIGPHGQPMLLDERMHDMLARHGPDSPNGRAHPQREAYFRAALRRVVTRLDDAGADPGWLSRSRLHVSIPG